MTLTEKLQIIVREAGLDKRQTAKIQAEVKRQTKAK